MYHGSPNYITYHAYLLTEVVKNAFKRHSSTGTQTDRETEYAQTVKKYGVLR